MKKLSSLILCICLSVSMSLTSIADEIDAGNNNTNYVEEEKVLDGEEDILGDEELNQFDENDINSEEEYADETEMKESKDEESEEIKKDVSKENDVSYTEYEADIYNVSSENWLWPVPSSRSITQKYSSSHTGLDIGALANVAMVATKSGTVVQVYTGCNNHSGIKNGKCLNRNICNPNVGINKNTTNVSYGYCNYGFGNGFVVKADDGTYYSYAHMNAVYVSKGQHISQGDTVGLAGDAGYANGVHCHYEIGSSVTAYGTWYAFTYINPNNISFIYGESESNPTPTLTSQWYRVNSSAGLDLNRNDNYSSGMLTMPDGAYVEYLGQGSYSASCVKVRYWNQEGYCSKNFLTPSDPPNMSPIGNTDAITSDSPRTIYLNGWAFDRDNYEAQLEIHVYVDDNYVGKINSANQERSDITGDHPGVGNYHGFSGTVTTSYSGSHKVDVYAINVGSGENTCIGSKFIDIKGASSPEITSVDVKNIDLFSGTYTVEAYITSEHALNRVQFPTWTIKNGQDDIASDWGTNSQVSGNISSLGGNRYKATYTVNVSDHSGERGIYRTDVYPYNEFDLLGEYVQNEVNMTPVGTKTVNDGRYHILSEYHLGYRLDNPDEGNPASGDNVNICSMDYNLEGEAFNVRYKGDGYYEIYRGECAVDVAGGKTTSGANIQMDIRNYSDSQAWIIDDYDEDSRRIRSKVSGLSLDLDESRDLNGTNVTTGNNYDGNDQKWRFLPEGTRTIADGDYYIVSASDSNMYLNAASLLTGGNVETVSQASGNNNLFTVKWIGNEAYEISINDYSLDVEGGKVDSWTNIQMCSKNDSRAQKWVIKDEGNGYYSIYSQCNALVVDMSGSDGTSAESKNVHMYKYHGEGNQLWRFVPYDGVKVDTCSLTIRDGAIGLNFFVRGITEDIAKAGMVSLNGKYCVIDKKQSDGTYRFTYHVAAKDMDKNITIALYDGEGKQIPFNNSSAIDGKFVYSVEKYINANKNDAELGELVSAMELYGKCAKSYFNNSTNSLDVKDVPTLYFYEKTMTGTMPSGLKYEGSSIVLNSKISIRHYFSTTGKINSYTFYSGSSEELSPVKVGNIYYVEIPNVDYFNLFSPYPITIMGNSQKCVLYYCVLSYAYSASQVYKSGDTNLNKLVKSLYWYMCAISHYF